MPIKWIFKHHLEHGVSIFQKIIIIKIVLIVVFVLTKCTDNPTASTFSTSIKFPLYKKAIYAIGHYSVRNDADSLLNLRVSSFYFDSTYISKDTTYLVGTYETLDPFSYDSPQSGRLLISLTNDWVFYQSSEIVDAGIDFLKPQIEMNVDTTALPTEKYGHFPIYPRNLIPNITKSIYRPANEGDAWGYSQVFREFHIKETKVWEDQYGSDFGYEVRVKHILFGFETIFDLVIDRHGIINSQSSTKYFDISEDGTSVDSTSVYWINRRIADYQDPGLLNTLLDYTNEVKVKGLKYIKE